MSELPESLRVAFPFLTSLAVGLLLGLQRQRTPSARAGLRTFALIALFGTATGLLAQATASAWMVPAGLLLTGATLIADYAREPRPAEDSGTTTVVAAMVCFSLGTMIWYGYQQLAVALAIAATVLLHFKAELHDWSRRLSGQDVASILQFAVLSFIILPILPDQGYGPYQALNPYHIWLMVVLISGVSLVGYLSLRFAGEGRGAWITAVLGGLVSSTATTLALARQVRADPSATSLAGTVIPVATLVVLLRLAVIVGVLAPSLLRDLAPVLGGGLALGLATTLALLRRAESETRVVAPQVRNPMSLATSVSFGLLYALVLVATAWLAEHVGAFGFYGAAFVSGLTDVDAITLSGVRLFGAGHVSASMTITAIVIAVTANLAFKLALVFALGGARLGRRCAAAMLATGIGLAGGLLLVSR